mmetsp:Transcript_34138/g.61554  ORF Transcript_34138/g.61554 Transcript_34138/m.61554 type:complete len:489 (-) Transcript_34138:410-1876(-)
MGIFSTIFKGKEDGCPNKEYCRQTFIQMWSRYHRPGSEEAVSPDPYALKPRSLPTVIPEPERLIAIGDLHGDYSKAMRALRVAGLIDTNGDWNAGKTVAVQVGDILDRGDSELRLLITLERLQRQAAAAGGRFHLLNGNHEVMNAFGDHRYGTVGSNVDIMAWQLWRDFNTLMKMKSGCRLSSSAAASSLAAGGRPVPFAQAATPTTKAKDISSNTGDVTKDEYFEEYDEADPIARRKAAISSAWSTHNYRFYNGYSRPFSWIRSVAYEPGGPIARRFFANRQIVLQVGSTVFAHGGLHPEHVATGLEKINAETQDWLLGNGEGGSNLLAAAKSRFASAANPSSAASSKSSHHQQQQQRPATTPPPEYLRSREAVVWARTYSSEKQAHCDCERLQRTLQMLPNAKRMVVGHTIQRTGVNTACDGKVVRVDVGLSKGCTDGNVEVLEVLAGGTVRKLQENLPPVELENGEGKRVRGVAMKETAVKGMGK